MSFLRGLFGGLFGPTPSAHRTEQEKPPARPWQDRVRELKLPPEGRQAVSPPVKRDPQLTNDDYRSALTQDGLSYGRDEDIAFVKAALDGVEWPKGITLRKHGEQLSKDGLRELGYRANLILSRECLAILTKKGREYPHESAQFIVSALEYRRSNKRRLSRTREAMGEGAMIQVYANNMAAGPCDACLALAAKPVPLSMAPAGPLPECPHPSQCVLHWRSHITFD